MPVFVRQTMPPTPDPDDQASLGAAQPGAELQPAAPASAEPPPRLPKRGKRRLGLSAIGLALMAAGYALMPGPLSTAFDVVPRPELSPALRTWTTAELAERLDEVLPLSWPPPATIKVGKLTVHTSYDPGLQQDLDRYMAAKRPPYAAIAAIDPLTGEVLALSSHSDRRGWRERHLGLVASFPAASVFKLVTAAGVLAEGRHQRLELIDFIGSKTARPGQWNMKSSVGRNAHWVTLEEAFAGSINPVFGKLGLFELKSEGLIQWGRQFGWGEAVTDQLPVEPSVIDIPEDPYGTAAVGSGYTTSTTLSPLHGAAVAAVTVNDGIFIRPGVVRSIVDEAGRVRYWRGALEGQQVVTPEVAAELRMMMQATIAYGTARRAYDDREGMLSELYVGGKTGTLTGVNPAGRTQWLVGWAYDPSSKVPLAFATVVVDSGRTDAKELSKVLLESYYQRRRVAPEGYWVGGRSPQSPQIRSLELMASLPPPQKSTGPATKSGTEQVASAKETPKKRSTKATSRSKRSRRSSSAAKSGAATASAKSTRSSAAKSSATTARRSRSGSTKPTPKSAASRKRSGTAGAS